MYVTHLVDTMLSDGTVAVRNPDRFEALCDALDSRGVEYTVSRGRGGWHLTTAPDLEREMLRSYHAQGAVPLDSD